MQVENLIAVTWTEAELKEALLLDMESELSNCVPGTEEYSRKANMIRHIRTNHCAMEWVNGKFCLSADGVANVENF